MNATLRAYHVALTPQFAAGRAARTFGARKEELLAKSASGKLKSDVGLADTASQPIAYCITSLGPAGAGDIESLFVEPDHRRKAVGTELTRRALAWLDLHNANSRTVVVASGNESAVKFYARFSFFPDHMALPQVSEAESREDYPTSDRRQRAQAPTEPEPSV